MGKKKTLKKLSSEGAFENLSVLEELDLQDPFRLGISEDIHLVSDEEQYPHMQVVTSQNMEDVKNIAAISFSRLLTYFQELVEEGETDWESPKVRKGIEAIMDIVGGAARKLHLLQGGAEQEKLSLTEYEALEAYYVSKVQPLLEGKGEVTKSWEKDWIKNSQSLLMDTENLGAQDFEAIIRDRVYELFSIHDSSGKPFFDASSIRKIKVFRETDGSFDISADEDPFVRMNFLIDKDLNGAAMQILSLCTDSITKYYKSKIRKKELEFVRLVHYAIMALMLAGNSRNTLEHRPIKSAHKYFEDFLFFLGKALAHPEYMKWIAYPETQNEPKIRILMGLVQDLSYALFTRKDAAPQEIQGLIKRLIRKGKEGVEVGGETIGRLLRERDAVDGYLTHFPNGPIMKILDRLKEQSENDFSFFSPIKQDNYPYHLFSVKEGRKELHFLRIPSPTIQSQIAKATLLPEFQAFLYELKERNEKLLMIHLQDKNSWVEEARCKTIENYAKQVDFAEFFLLLTLPKETHFYHQIGEFLAMDDAESFFDHFKEEIHLPENFGFTFPQAEKQSIRYLERILPEIHELFFDKKEELSRKERLDFIEITYLFLMVESMAQCTPKYISFTSKDSIDKGPPEAAMIYFFSLLLEGKKIEEKDYDRMRWIIYAPALKYRERAPDSRDLYRIFSALALMEERKKDHKKWQKLLSKKFTLS